MVQESIFALVGQHDAYSAQMRRRGTSMMPQHAATYSDSSGLDHATNAPLSSDDDHRPETGGFALAPKAAAQRNLSHHAPRGRTDEADANEVARRRQQQEMRGGAMATALAPELTYQMKMQKSLGVSPSSSSPSSPLLHSS